MARMEPIRDKKQAKKLAEYWLARGHFRNYALIVLGVCTALRVSDLLRLTLEDAYDGESGAFRPHIAVTEQKTGKRKAIALNRQAVQALRLLRPHRRNAYIFASNRKEVKPISRVQAWRIVKEAAKAIKAPDLIGYHSLRKTFGYHAWVSGVNPVLLMDIYNHSAYETTKRYLGVTQDDRDKVYLGLALF